MKWCHPNSVPKDFLLVVFQRDFSIFAKCEDAEYLDDGRISVEACFVKHTRRATKWKAKKALKKFYMDAIRQHIESIKS